MLPELFLVAVEAVDEELRAVPPGLFLGVDRLQVGRAILVPFGNRDLLPGNAGVEPVEDHGNAQPPRIDDPCLAVPATEGRSVSPPSTASRAASAASFITVSIVPSTGSRTEE